MLIPLKRLKWLPEKVRLAHEYCFFLHDEIVRMLAEYETAKAHVVSFQFSNNTERKKFERLAKKQNAVDALRALERHSEARRVILNTITMAMVSDSAHHIYEALRCLEKRKVVPAFNLLRKPLLDNMTYLSWMVADEDGFYTDFASGDPTKMTQKTIGNRRKHLFEKAIENADLMDIVNAGEIISSVFDPRNNNGLYLFFQHAVHLITVDRIELKTSPENFNFIFKSPTDDDVYELLYANLPTVLLYMIHLVLTLYERVKPMDPGARKAVLFRSENAYRLLHDQEGAGALVRAMGDALSPRVKCTACGTPLKVTPHNAARLLMAESFRCTRCRRISPFPLSWMF
ncbi:hypothetical protein [Thiobacillus sp.]|uniref:hypothetical protein n=1 Tax=Thiobacillus sp. TaxID=924 RepID=UPI0011D5CA77|nr:hypothetical protein [Thiobacillus sp.]TXH73162.1 MAG: hypothetical protein E6Q82_14735 [Thiobacillus sp.]